MNKIKQKLLLIIISFCVIIQIVTYSNATEGTISSTSIRLRKSASTSSEVLETILKGEKVEIISEENQTTEENTAEKIVADTTITQDSNQTKVEENKQQKVSNQKNTNQSKSTSQNISNNKVEKSTANSNVKKQEQVVETNKQTVQTSKVTQQNQTKYVRNDAMIQKIKSVIENNVTEDMKTYGYTIVVDSTIKNSTNQFTFTESRVKSNIRYSFGTIRIYAEDYYSNGQFIMTECYIL